MPWSRVVGQAFSLTLTCVSRFYETAHDASAGGCRAARSAAPVQVRSLLASRTLSAAPGCARRVPGALPAVSTRSTAGIAERSPSPTPSCCESGPGLYPVLSVQDSVEDKRIVVPLCPAAKKLFGSLAKSIYTLWKEVHSLPFSSEFGGYDSTIERGDGPQFLSGWGFRPAHPFVRSNNSKMEHRRPGDCRLYLTCKVD